MLTGTFDKILEYEGWVLPDQHYRFAHALRRVDRILVVGCDKAINTRLIRWLARSQDNRLIVAHGKPEEARDRAKDAIRLSWDKWAAAGRLRVISAWAAELDPASIQAVLA
jgi:hypothetical protein